MPQLTDDELERYRKDHRELGDLRTERGDLELLIVAAMRCGFVNKHQEDALYFALSKITKQPRAVLRAIIHVTPKGFNGRQT